jgi:predicted amidohydrolase
VIKSKRTAGVIQAAPAFFDLDKSVDLTLDWLNEAAKAGCDPVLFPESYIPGYPADWNLMQSVITVARTYSASM